MRIIYWASRGTWAQAHPQTTWPPLDRPTLCWPRRKTKKQKLAHNQQSIKSSAASVCLLQINYNSTHKYCSTTNQGTFLRTFITNNLRKDNKTNAAPSCCVLARPGQLGLNLASSLTNCYDAYIQIDIYGKPFGMSVVQYWTPPLLFV